MLQSSEVSQIHLGFHAIQIEIWIVEEINKLIAECK